MGATENVRRILVDERSNGAAILLISEDLDEIFAISDRIAVLFEGRIAGEMTDEDADLDTIGLMMAGAHGSTETDSVGAKRAGACRMTQPASATRPTTSTWRLERVSEQPRWLYWLSPLILVVLALIVGAGLLTLAGAPPWVVYRRMADLAFGSAYGWSDTTIKATPLILAGLGVSIAFRMRLWNIGAEGQLFLGAFFATGVALFVLPPETPQALMLLAMGVAGFIGGALWGVIPGVLKAKLNVNEIITTLMLNYVAILWNNYWVYGPWGERGFGLTPHFSASRRGCRG